MEVLGDLFRFLVERKKWWLAPIVVVLLLIGAVIVLGGGTAIPSASEESTHGCFTTLSMTGWGQQTSPSGPSPCKRRGTFWRKPKQGEVARSSEHFFVIPSIFFCHSKRSFLSFRARARNPVRGCFALLSMTQ
jgi:hypothetical protein